METDEKLRRELQQCESFLGGSYVLTIVKVESDLFRMRTRSMTRGTAEDYLTDDHANLNPSEVSGLSSEQISVKAERKEYNKSYGEDGVPTIGYRVELVGSEGIRVPEGVLKIMNGFIITHFRDYGHQTKYTDIYDDNWIRGVKYTLWDHYLPNVIMNNNSDRSMRYFENSRIHFRMHLGDEKFCLDSSAIEKEVAKFKAFVLQAAGERREAIASAIRVNAEYRERNKDTISAEEAKRRDLSSLVGRKV